MFSNHVESVVHVLDLAQWGRLQCWRNEAAVAAHSSTTGKVVRIASRGSIASRNALDDHRR
jgi:hypothetical protein